MDGIKLLGSVNEQRERWLELRKDTIGSSEIAIIAGLNNYKTPLELWAEKTGKIQGQSDNQYMKLGRHMEKFIGELFAEKKDLRLSESKELWRHKDVAWATASPDFYIIEGEIIEKGIRENVTGLVECKNVNYRQIGKWLDDNIPDSYYLQTVWQLGVLGLQQGFLAGLVGASPDDFFTPEVKFSAPLFNQLLDLGNKFMLNVKQDIPPQAGAGDLKLLEKITKRNLSEAIILPDTLEADLAELEMIKKEKSGINKSLKNLEDDEKRIKAKVIQKMGTATTAMLGDYTVNLNKVHRSPQEATEYWMFNLKKAK